MALLFSLGQFLAACLTDPHAVDTSTAHGFKIAIINDTKHELHDVTCTYDGGRGLGGEMELECLLLLTRTVLRKATFGWNGNLMANYDMPQTRL